MSTFSECRTPRPVSQPRNSCRSQFSIGGVTVEIFGDCPEDVALVPSLRAFETACDRPDIRMRVEWVPSLTPQNKTQLFDSGTTWRCYQDEAGLEFDFNSPPFGIRPYKRLQVDPHFKHATVRMNQSVYADFPVDPEPLEYPLDELLIMHRLTQENAIELHACGIVRSDGIGNLFVGHSGAGKSTTTRLWTEHEPVEVLSDDRIILRTDHDRTPRSHRNSKALSVSNRCNDSIRMYGTPWHGEARYASPGSAPLATIFILEHGEGNTLTQLAPGEAIAELFARSFVPFHRHEYVEAALEFLQRVVATIPCYRYRFEPNHSAVDTILDLHH